MKTLLLHWGQFEWMIQFIYCAILCDFRLLETLVKLFISYWNLVNNFISGQERVGKHRCVLVRLYKFSDNICAGVILTADTPHPHSGKIQNYFVVACSTQKYKIHVHENLWNLTSFFFNWRWLLRLLHHSKKIHCFFI